MDKQQALQIIQKPIGEFTAALFGDTPERDKALEIQAVLLVNHDLAQSGDAKKLGDWLFSLMNKPELNLDTMIQDTVARATGATQDFPEGLSNVPAGLTDADIQQRLTDARARVLAAGGLAGTAVPPLGGILKKFVSSDVINAALGGQLLLRSLTQVLAITKALDEAKLPEFPEAKIFERDPPLIQRLTSKLNALRDAAAPYLIETDSFMGDLPEVLRGFEKYPSAREKIMAIVKSLAEPDAPSATPERPSYTGRVQARIEENLPQLSL